MTNKLKATDLQSRDLGVMSRDRKGKPGGLKLLESSDDAFREQTFLQEHIDRAMNQFPVQPVFRDLGALVLVVDQRWPMLQIISIHHGRVATFDGRTAYGLDRFTAKNDVDEHGSGRLRTIRLHYQLTCQWCQELRQSFNRRPFDRSVHRIGGASLDRI